MNTVFEYFDYRQFLKDYYDEQKKVSSLFSYRYIAQKVHLDAGYVVKLLQGKVHITAKSIPCFTKLCKLGTREKHYFETLVHFTKAKTQKDIKTWFKQLLDLKSVETKTLAKEQFEFYQKWYYTAIRSLIGIEGFNGDYTHLARRLTPPITIAQAKKAIWLLEKLGLIKKDDDTSSYFLTDAFITTGDAWKALTVRAFQKETMQLAEESLERHPKELRDISTVTIALPGDALPEIRERIAEFRKTIFTLVNEYDTVDEVYELNIQLFPLSLSREVGP